MASSWAFDFFVDSFFSLCFFISTRSLRVTLDSCSLFEKSISPFESLSSCSFFLSNAFALSSFLSSFGRSIFSWTSFKILSASSFDGRRKCVFALWFFSSFMSRNSSSLENVSSKFSGIFPFSIAWIVSIGIWVWFASWLIVSFFRRLAILSVQK